MSHSIKTHHPGAILVKELKTGEYLYYRPFKNRTWKCTGLLYSKRNVKIVEQILQSEYEKFISGAYNINNENHKIISTYSSFNNYTENVKDKRSKNTIRDYKFSFEIIISGDYDIQSTLDYRGKEIQLIEKDIMTFIKTNESKLKNVTINKHLRQFQVYVNHLISEYNYPYINYYKKYRLNEAEKEIVPYTKEEAELIINEAKKQDEILYLLLMLFYLTGGRLNEWINARFDEGPYLVDMENRSIKFRNKIRKDRYQIIPMTNEVFEILNRLKIIESDRVTYKGKVIPYSPSSKASINRKINRIEAKLGIKLKGRSTHGFRRLLATELFANNIPFDVIKDIMRHSSINTTMQSYRKLDQSRLKDALEQLNR